MEKYYKYPRTYHLPSSEGLSSDDKRLLSMDHFVGKEVVVTEKLDGQNTSCYNDHIHARSLDSTHHPSQDWIKGFWSTFNYKIPEGWRICGENMYAKHSIHYSQLETYFYVFSIWDENNQILTWDDTLDVCQELGLATVPLLYRGQYDTLAIENLYIPDRKPDLMEGYVIRINEAFHYNNFESNMAKWVRKNHVQTTQHWAHAQITKNKLK